MSARMVDRDPHAPFRLVATVVVGVPGLYEGLDVGAVEVTPHNPHSFAVRPVELPTHGVEMKLLGGVGATAGKNGDAVTAIKVHAFDRPVVSRRNPHVGPINMPALHIECDTIGDEPPGDDERLVGAVGVDREQPSVAAGFEYEQLSG